MTRLTTVQLKQLEEALLDAFPSYGDLARLFQHTFGSPLPHIAHGQNITETVFQIINWAAAHDSAEELIKGAAATNPDNKKVQACLGLIIEPRPKPVESPIAQPVGVVTFLFTDIEGSTKRWEENPEAMRVALARHDQLLRQEIEKRRGYVFKTIGDAFCAAFETATNALTTALAIQRGCETESWGAVGPIRVRIALHTGSAEEREGDYFGTPGQPGSAGSGGRAWGTNPSYGRNPTFNPRYTSFECKPAGSRRTPPEGLDAFGNSVSDYGPGSTNRLPSP